MPQIEEILTHAEDALARLATQYRNNDQVYIPGLIEGAGERAQTIETALWQIMTQTGLSTIAWNTNGVVDTGLPYSLPFALGGGASIGSTAQGAQLDVLGRILNFARGGLDDADYFTALVAWVRVLLSSGTINNIITIFSLLGLVNPAVAEYFPASFIVEAITATPFSPATLINAGAFLQASKAGGVNGLLHYSLVPAAQTFTLGTVAEYGTSSPLGFNNGYFSGIV